ncbi:MAG: creatininase family protein [Armatimonadetes bacterium]|nr:creatininase family protein [Armatimonadota bacterium]MDW8122015.1 creatininase family protein [Armatimonadota bacterium]
MARPWVLSELTLEDVRSQTIEVAVFPVGACEPHGLHLPYGTDTYEVVAIAEEACHKAYERGASVVCLPPFPYGVNANLLSFPMTIHIQQKTLNLIVQDIVASLERHGIEKMVILNGHGGNEFRGGLRDLFGKTNVWLFLVEWWKVSNDEIKKLVDEPGEHAGEMETSLCLRIVPDLVRMDRADPGKVRRFRFEALEKGWAWTARPWERLTTHSGVGDPRKASEDKGERLIQIITDEISEFLVALAKTPVDETFPFA